MRSTTQLELACPTSIVGVAASAVGIRTRRQAIAVGPARARAADGPVRGQRTVADALDVLQEHPVDLRIHEEFLISLTLSNRFVTLRRRRRRDVAAVSWIGL